MIDSPIYMDVVRWQARQDAKRIARRGCTCGHTKRRKSPRTEILNTAPLRMAVTSNA